MITKPCSPVALRPFGRSADDQDLARAGLRMIVDSAPGLTVVGEAATAQLVVFAYQAGLGAPAIT
jgi:DNA-binding NarL/FixJ family response regulator